MKLALSLLLLLSLTGAHAQTPAKRKVTVDEMVALATRGQLGNDETVKLTMVLVDKAGQKETRTLTTWFRKATRDSKEDKTLLKFHSPADVAGTALLSTQEPGADAGQWLYLPALKRVKRLVTSDNTGYFVGTDFTYQDLQIENTREYTYERIADEDVDGRRCYKIVATPKNKSISEKTGYSKRIFWIDVQDVVVLRLQYFNLSGTHVKTFSASDVQKFGPKKKPMQIIMDNLERNHKTYAKLHEVKMNTDLSDSLFTQSELSR